MVKNDKRIIIRIPAKDKELLFDYCNKNNIKLSSLLRECALNYVKENNK